MYFCACVYLCAQNLGGPRRLERNSQSACQDSQMGCELFSQKIDPVPARSERLSIPNHTHMHTHIHRLSVTVYACVCWVSCQVSIGVFWEGTIGEQEVRVHRGVMTVLSIFCFGGLVLEYTQKGGIKRTETFEHLFSHAFLFLIQYKWEISHITFQLSQVFSLSFETHTCVAAPDTMG